MEDDALNDRLLNVNINPNPLFYPIFKSKKRLNIMMGGRGRSGSFTASQLILTKCLQSKNLRIGLMRYVLSDVRDSLWQELLDRIDEYDLNELIELKNDKDMRMTFNGNKIICKGFMKSDSARSAQMKSLAGFTDFFIEEFEEISNEELWDQFNTSIRPRKDKITGEEIFPQFYLICNPPPKDHWFVQRYFNLEMTKLHKEYKVDGIFYQPKLKWKWRFEVEYVHGTWRDNQMWIQEMLDIGGQKYLNDVSYNLYEHYKDSDNMDTRERYLHQILGLIPSENTGIVFRHWNTITDEEFDKLDVPFSFGVDFGYSQDPSAIVKVKQIDNKVYFKEILYQKNMTAVDIAQFIISNIPNYLEFSFFCDGSRPEIIEELIRQGIDNAQKAQKGDGSVLAGIDMLKSMQCYYTTSSHNLDIEVKNYSYGKKKYGNHNLPVDRFNHLLDACRYVVYTENGATKFNKMNDYYLLLRKRANRKIRLSV